MKLRDLTTKRDKFNKLALKYQQLIDAESNAKMVIEISQATAMTNQKISKIGVDPVKLAMQEEKFNENKAVIDDIISIQDDYTEMNTNAEAMDDMQAEIFAEMQAEMEPAEVAVAAPEKELTAEEKAKQEAEIERLLNEIAAGSAPSEKIKAKA